MKLVIVLKCRACGIEFENRSNYCPSCGEKAKGSKLIPLLAVVALLCTSAFGFILFTYYSQTDFRKAPQSTAVIDLADEEQAKEQAETKIAIADKQKKSLPATEVTKQVQQDVSQVIDTSLDKVVTIYTDTSQGSGFLINDKGDVLTNAHVVEGAVDVTAQDRMNNEFAGTVIGYSTNTDVAIVRVVDLAGNEPLDIETAADVSMGEEVLALGSPLGLKNTATLGYITGVNRSFFIGERSYDHIYQMSAHIAEGSSGGPLISVETGKAVAINSARFIEEDSIGFSIPIKDIYSLISEWISAPLSEEELYSLFYTDNGQLYYQEEDGNDVYFDGGDYSEEEDTYYEIPDDWYDDSEEYDKVEDESTVLEKDTESEDVTSEFDDEYLDDDEQDYEEESTYEEENMSEDELTDEDENMSEEELTYEEEDGTEDVDE